MKLTHTSPKFLHWPQSLALAALGALFLAAASPVFAQNDAAKADDASVAEAPEGTNAKASAFTEHERHNHDGHGGAPSVFADRFVEKGRTNHDDAVVIRGNLTVDGTLEGSAVVVMGDVKINGRITQDVVVTLGSVTLGPEAEIGGDVVLAGGHLQRGSGSRIRGEVVEIDPGKIPGLSGLVPWFTHCLLWGRPLAFSVGWAWGVAALFLLFNLILLALFPRPIQTCVEAMERQPVSAFFVGILAKFLTGLLCVLLAVSVVGLIALPFVMAAWIVGLLFGKITLYRYAGQQFGAQTGLEMLRKPAPALIAGTAMFYLLYTIPFLGLLIWGFTGLFGLGAVVMATFQKYRDERSKNLPPPPAPAPRVDPSAPPAMEGQAPVPPVFGMVPAESFDASLLPRAGFWVRLAASLLDFIVVLVPIKLLLHLNHPQPFLLALLAYHIVFWSWKGTTIGGIVLGLKVVRVDGRPVNFAVALVRGLAAIFSIVVAGLGFLWAGLGPEKQSWHDKIAGTTIVKVPKGMSLL